MPDTVEIHVWLDRALHERLRRAEFRHRLTKAAVVREALRRELDRLDRLPAEAASAPAAPKRRGIRRGFLR
jgi:hypothetical protein